MQLARRQVKALSKGVSGRLSIARSRRGQVELKTSPRQPGGSVTLPFRWCEADWADCYVRIRNIYALWLQGHALPAAAEIAAGRAPGTKRDWPALLDAFRQWKQTADNAIKLTTWQHDYEPALTMAVELLSGKTPPLRAQAVILACVGDWRSGSRMRKIRVRSLVQFFNYCVEQHHLPEAWIPPQNLNPLIGAEKPQEAVRQKAEPFASDQQILDLIASLPYDTAADVDRQAARQWADATMLMAELGLRPIELLHLKVRTDPLSGEPHWWCTYQKRGGNGSTLPRRVYPLPLQSADGELQRWNLLERWQAGLITLPPLRSGNGAADCWKTYFSRRPHWISLKERMQQQQDKRLTSYSFRHSYSVRGTRRGVDSGSMAKSMGHSLQTHCQHYPWAERSGTEVAFAEASRRVEQPATSAGSHAEDRPAGLFLH